MRLKAGGRIEVPPRHRNDVVCLEVEEFTPKNPHRIGDRTHHA